MCQFYSLSKCLSPSDIRKVLSSLPRTLDETYERILVNISIEFQSKAINALKWIIYSQYHVDLEMLADAIVIDHEADPPFNLGDRLLDPSQLLEILPGLITTEGLFDHVEIAHFSVVEYLESARIVDGPANVFHLNESKANISITKGCFEILKSYSHPINQRLLGDYTREFSPLELHAWFYWPSYVESLNAPIDPEISRLVVDFAVNIDSIQQRHHYKIKPTLWSRAFIKSPGKPLDNGLYAACDWGAINTARIFLDAGADVDFQGEYLGTALQIAAKRNRPEIVRVLLDAGADVNSKAGTLGTPLQIAAAYGDLESVKLLLEAGADINLSGGKYGTALQAAAMSISDRPEMIRVLLEAGADVNLQAENGVTALQLAAAKGYLGIVKLLLEAGADINLTGGEYGTALEAAQKYKHEQVADMLLKAEAK